MLSDQFYMGATLAGFILGLSMIFSVGPQNMQLIKAGASRCNSLAVATTGYLSEILIVSLGLYGGGAPLGAKPEIGLLLRALGVAFLLWYGLSAITRGLSDRRAATAPPPTVSRRGAVVAMLAVTWLNPLVYVEVMFLVGVMSSAFAHFARIWFGIGFLVASAIRFYGWSLAGGFFHGWLSTRNGRQQFAMISGCLLLCSAALLASQVVGAF